MLNCRSLFVFLLGFTSTVAAQNTSAIDSSNYFARHTIQLQFGRGFYISNTKLNAFPVEDPSSIAFNINWGYSITQHWALDLTLQSNAFTAINPWTTGKNVELPDAWQVVGHQDQKSDERNGKVLSSGMILGAVYNTYLARSIQWSIGGGIGFINYGNFPEYTMYFKELNTTNRGQIDISNQNEYSEFMMRIKSGVHLRKSKYSRVGLGFQCSYDYSITNNAIETVISSNSEEFNQIELNNSNGAFHHLNWLISVAVFL